MARRRKRAIPVSSIFTRFPRFIQALNCALVSHYAFLGAKAGPKASPSSESSSECRAAVTNAIRERPQQGIKSAAEPQKALSTARKPPAKWTDDAKQKFLQTLREADGEFPAKTVQGYADFIAANLHSPVKLEELLSFLRKRDADSAAVVGRIERLAETLRP